MFSGVNFGITEFLGVNTQYFCLPDLISSGFIDVRGIGDE
jgi:hypothetical protein